MFLMKGGLNLKNEYCSRITQQQSNTLNLHLRGIRLINIIFSYDIINYQKININLDLPKSQVHKNQGFNFIHSQIFDINNQQQIYIFMSKLNKIMTIFQILIQLINSNDFDTSIEEKKSNQFKQSQVYKILKQIQSQLHKPDIQEITEPLDFGSISSSSIFAPSLSNTQSNYGLSNQFLANNPSMHTLLGGDFSSINLSGQGGIGNPDLQKCLSVDLSNSQMKFMCQEDWQDKINIYDQLDNSNAFPNLLFTLYQTVSQEEKLEPEQKNTLTSDDLFKRKKDACRCGLKNQHLVAKNLEMYIQVPKDQKIGKLEEAPNPIRLYRTSTEYENNTSSINVNWPLYNSIIKNKTEQQKVKKKSILIDDESRNKADSSNKIDKKTVIGKIISMRYKKLRTSSNSSKLSYTPKNKPSNLADINLNDYYYRFIDKKEDEVEDSNLVSSQTIKETKSIDYDDGLLIKNFKKIRGSSWSPKLFAMKNLTSISHSNLKTDQEYLIGQRMRFPLRMTISIESIQRQIRSFKQLQTMSCDWSVLEIKDYLNQAQNDDQLLNLTGTIVFNRHTTSLSSEVTDDSEKKIIKKQKKVLRYQLKKIIHNLDLNHKCMQIMDTFQYLDKIQQNKVKFKISEDDFN